MKKGNMDKAVQPTRDGTWFHVADIPSAPQQFVISHYGATVDGGKGTTTDDRTVCARAQLTNKDDQQQQQQAGDDEDEQLATASNERRGGIIGLEPGTMYKIRCRAVNSFGNSDWSQTASFKTSGPGLPGASKNRKFTKCVKESPTAPSGIQLVKASVNALEISWTPSPTASRYTIQIQKADNPPEPQTERQSGVRLLAQNQRRPFGGGPQTLQRAASSAIGGGGSTPVRAVCPRTRQFVASCPRPTQRIVQQQRRNVMHMDRSDSGAAAVVSSSPISSAPTLSPQQQQQSSRAVIPYTPSLRSSSNSNVTAPVSPPPTLSPQQQPQSSSSSRALIPYTPSLRSSSTSNVIVLIDDEVCEVEQARAPEPETEPPEVQLIELVEEDVAQEQQQQITQSLWIKQRHRQREQIRQRLIRRQGGTRMLLAIQRQQLARDRQEWNRNEQELTQDTNFVLDNLSDAANRMRISCIEQASDSKSADLTSSCSAAEILAALFFCEMLYNVKEPRSANSDRFVLSKISSYPLLNAVWEEAGQLKPGQLLSLSRMESDRMHLLGFIDVDVSLPGQGLSFAAGMALVCKRVDKMPYRVYCLMGDEEITEGSAWEAAAWAGRCKLDNLLVILDVSRQSDGWSVICVDGHDLSALMTAYGSARKVKGKPTLIIANTLKDKGVEGVSGKPALLEAIQDRMLNKNDRMDWPPQYEAEFAVSTQQAYCHAVGKLATVNKRVFVLNGQPLFVGIGIGMSSRGRVLPHIINFAAFFSRAADQIRMGASANVKFAGFNCDAPVEEYCRQQTTDELAFFRTLRSSVIFYPSDAVSAERATELAAKHIGTTYTRLCRQPTPVLYSSEDVFNVGECKVIYAHPQDTILLVSAGVALHECMKAYDLMLGHCRAAVIDLFCVEPLDLKTLLHHARRVHMVLAVEEQFEAGGIGETVCCVLSQLRDVRVKCIRLKGLPHPNPPGALELLYGKAAYSIEAEVMKFLAS
uniref:transketolase n=1 Tax=Globodera rostochiensis TaxID=31243 RepID=A0A914HC05_GLORO